MPAKKKSSSRKYGKAASKTVESAMRRKKKGTLKSGQGGKGGTVKSRKQAIAIGLFAALDRSALPALAGFERTLFLAAHRAFDGLACGLAIFAAGTFFLSWHISLDRK